MKADVYRQVAALHASCIDQGFLTTLGVPFLTLMYRAIDEAEESFLLVEERNGHVVGFVSGSCGMGPIYRHMLRRPVSLVLALLPSLVRPSRLKRIFDIVRYGRGSSGSEGLPTPELLSIAVSLDARGLGVAESLFRKLEMHFRLRGINAFKITVGDALTAAHRFYARMGAVPVGRTEVHAGEGSTVYVQYLVESGQ